MEHSEIEMCDDDFERRQHNLKYTFKEDKPSKSGYNYANFYKIRTKNFRNKIKNMY